jgi:hypothetical protein
MEFERHGDSLSPFGPLLHLHRTENHPSRRQQHQDENHYPISFVFPSSIFPHVSDQSTAGANGTGPVVAFKFHSHYVKVSIAGGSSARNPPRVGFQQVKAAVERRT